MRPALRLRGYAWDAAEARGSRGRGQGLDDDVEAVAVLDGVGEDDGTAVDEDGDADAARGGRRLEADGEQSFVDGRRFFFGNPIVDDAAVFEVGAGRRLVSVDLKFQGGRRNFVLLIVVGDGDGGLQARDVEHVAELWFCRHLIFDAIAFVNRLGDRRGCVVQQDFGRYDVLCVVVVERVADLAARRRVAGGFQSLA